MNAEGKPEILVIDDEEQIRRVLRDTLEASGFRVREAESGRIALGEMTLGAPDAVILDLGLPDLPGTEVLRVLRQLYSMPVLILTVIGREDAKISALEGGADDYITKPFSSGELVARLRALLRRVRHPAAAQGHGFRFGAVEVDLERSRVTRDGRPVKLTAIEFRLLQLFILNRDRVLTHRRILTAVWGARYAQRTHYLRTYVMRLRRKLGDEADLSGHFQTESGVGYRFVTDPVPAG